MCEGQHMLLLVTLKVVACFIVYVNTHPDVAVEHPQGHPIYSKGFKNPGCIRPENGSLTVHLPVPGNCRMFYKCQSGFAYLMHCPAGLHWSVQLNRCEWPHNAKCEDVTRSAINRFGDLVNPTSTEDSTSSSEQSGPHISNTLENLPSETVDSTQSETLSDAQTGASVDSSRALNTSSVFVLANSSNSISKSSSTSKNEILSGNRSAPKLTILPTFASTRLSISTLASKTTPALQQSKTLSDVAISQPLSTPKATKFFTSIRNILITKAPSVIPKSSPSPLSSVVPNSSNTGFSVRPSEVEEPSHIQLSNKPESAISKIDKKNSTFQTPLEREGVNVSLSDSDINQTRVLRENTTNSTSIDETLLRAAKNNTLDPFMYCKLKNKTSGYLPYPGDCKRFVQCSNRKGYIHACPGALLFNSKIRTCSHLCL